MLFAVIHKRAESCNRSIFRRLRAMTALSAGDKLNVGIALFKDTHHTGVLCHLLHKLADNRAALVDYDIRLDTLGFKPIPCHFRAGTGGLLAVAVRKINVLLRHKAFQDKLLNSLNSAEKRIFAVHRTSAENLAVLNGCAERLVFPISAHCGNNVLMRHKHHRTRAVLALPFIKKHVAPYFYFLTGCGNIRKLLVKHLMKSRKIFVTAVRNRRTLDKSFKAVYVPVLIFHYTPLNCIIIHLLYYETVV